MHNRHHTGKFLMHPSSSYSTRPDYGSHLNQVTAGTVLRPAVHPTGFGSSTGDRDVQLGQAFAREIAKAGGLLRVDERSWKKFNLNVFGSRPSGRMLDYFRRFPHVFDCEPDSLVPGTMEVRSKATIELCSDHCSKDGCHKLACEGLHCCKFFLYGPCKFNQKCKYGHDLTQPHNRNLLARYFLDGLSAKEIGVLLKCGRSKQAFPTACKFYNNEGGCRSGEKGEKCPHLHVCRHYILDDCTFGRHCKRSHNIYDAQPKKILAKYGIRTDRSPKEVLEELRSAIQTNGKSETGETDGEINSSDEDDSDDALGAVGPAPLVSRRRTDSSGSSTRESTEICVFFLCTKCNYGKSCANKHPKFTLPYQWQYEVHGEWKDFEKESNDEIEVVFCDPKNVECFIDDLGFGRVVAINFDAMKCKDKSQETYNVRRLSTRSNRGQSSKHLFLTEWCWYWKDTRTEEWIEFGTWENITSEDLEEEFSSNPNSHVPFESDNKTSLVADLRNMKRIEERSGDLTDIRRRPLLFDPKTKQPCQKTKCQSRSKPDVSSLRLGTIYPETWNLEFKSDNDYFQIVPVSPGSKEFSDVEKLFRASLPNASVKQIRRIQNAELWDGFYRKKTWMEKKLKPGGQLNMRQLFHGTRSLYVDAICQQGFDWRICGSSVGTAYGKGSYFARDASYSEKYTDCKKMFLVRVLVGEYAVGNSSMVRPPPKDQRQPFGELYDSVVNMVSDPSIFVVFTQEQAYPEYLIEF